MKLHHICMLALGLFSLSGAYSAEKAKPNIIFFLVDDMGWQDTSVPFLTDASGKAHKTPLNQFYKTPSMEKLAQNGMKFTQAYCAPVCSPSRVSLMTGQSPVTHRVTNWTSPNAPVVNDGPADPKLRAPEWDMGGITKDEADQSLPRLLKNNGYKTIHVGKAHFATNQSPYKDPRELGFDVNIAGTGIGHPGSYRSDKNFGEGTSHHVKDLEDFYTKDQNPDEATLKNNFLTSALTQKLNKEIDQTKEEGKPFFAYMAHYAVHQPFGDPDPNADVESYKKSMQNLKDSSTKNKNLLPNYATLIEGMDQSLGNIIAHLKKRGIAKDTLIIFMSDNGGDAPINQNPKLYNEIGAVAPLRGRKGTPYEGGSRVPLIVAWAEPDPNHPMQQALPIPQNSTNDHIVAIWDVLPTLMELTQTPAPQNIDGVSIVDLLKNSPEPKRPNAITQHFPHSHGYGRFFSSYREGEWKVIYSYKDAIEGKPAWQLYNLSRDIGESKDLATSPRYKQKLKEMAQLLVKNLQEKNAQFPLIKNPDNPKEMLSPTTIILP